MNLCDVLIQLIINNVYSYSNKHFKQQIR